MRTFIEKNQRQNISSKKTNDDRMIVVKRKSPQKPFYPNGKGDPSQRREQKITNREL